MGSECYVASTTPCTVLWSCIKCLIFCSKCSASILHLLSRVLLRHDSARHAWDYFLFMSAIVFFVGRHSSWNFSNGRVCLLRRDQSAKPPDASPLVAHAHFNQRPQNKVFGSVLTTMLTYLSHWRWHQRSNLSALTALTLDLSEIERCFMVRLSTQRLTQQDSDIVLTFQLLLSSRGILIKSYWACVVRWRVRNSTWKFKQRLF